MTLSIICVAICSAALTTIHAQTPWKSWPTRISTGNVEVTGLPLADGRHVYSTRHFRFSSDVTLSPQALKDMARLFELTHALLEKSPFGIQAAPIDGLFQASLFGRKRDYLSAGGPADTTGVYLVKEKKFLAPLELMGMESAAAGWRKSSNATFDPTPVIHELTHMLSHDTLGNLPLWLNEGYAEYLSNIPIGIEGFDGRPTRIRDRILALLASDKKTVPPKLVPVSTMLAMPDPAWREASDQKSASVELMRRRYRTAHLIVYHYLHIEGEAGVTKLTQLLEGNRGHQARYQDYLAKYKVFENELAHFKRLPGVKEHPDKRIEYPSNLTPPQAPTKPFTNPDQLKLGSIHTLLDDGDVKRTGLRIEESLKNQLGIPLVFAE